MASHAALRGQKYTLGKFFIALMVVLSGPLSRASSVAIPIPDAKDPSKNIKTPAMDLVLKGQVIDSDQAATLIKQGVDISTLDPKPNDAWKPVSLGAEDVMVPQLPENSVLNFVEDYPAASEMARAIVEYKGETYHMIFSFQGHTGLLRNALLRKLGYPISTPENLHNVTVNFKSKAERDGFLDLLNDRLAVEVDKWWVVSKTDTQVKFRDVIIQNARVLVPPFHWGVWNAGLVRGRRALRSLIVPYTLAEIPQSINVFSWEVGKILDNGVVFTQPYASEFDETSFDDGRWISRKIAQLTRQEWASIVASGHYPSDISQLLVEKLIARRNHLVELFGLKKEFADIAYNSHITIGAVKDGRATQERYEGFVQRFTYGDIANPLTKGEIFRFIKIEAISSALSKVIGDANKFLSIQNISDVIAKHSSDVVKSIENHLATKGPAAPYSVPLQTWGGPIAGVSVSANRNVVSGTYYGIDDEKARVQLVDNIGVQASVGYFMGLDGLKNVSIGAYGNVALQRNYLHVKPVESLKAADKESWKNLYIPKFMSHLVKAVDPAAPFDDAQKEMKAFIDDLKPNEMFVVVDSLTGGVGANVAIPVLSLLSLPIGGTATFVSSTSETYMIMRRTTFLKTAEGHLQVYLQSVQANAFNQGFDFNWWIKIWSWQGTIKNAEAQARVYDLTWEEKSPSGEDWTEEKERRARKVMQAVRALMRSNDRDILEANFAPYELDHKLFSKIQRTSFLFLKWEKAEETHQVRVRPPIEYDENGVPKFNPKDYERTLASFQVIKRQGKNYYSLVSDIINAVAPGFGPKDAGGTNPSSSFFGSGNWTNFRTEGETTVNSEFQPVTAIENYWAGWKISKAGLFKVLDVLESRIKSLNLNQPVIHRDVFNDTDDLRFYEIRANLIVYKTGMQKIKEKLSNGRNEQKVYNDLVVLAGKDFQPFCRAARDQFGPNGVQVYYGEEKTYDCALPWMKKVLDLRRQIPKNDKLAELKWATKMVEALEGNVPTPTWLNWVGKENFFYVIKVSGFKTHDENTDHTYISDMVGDFNPDLGTGIFSDFVNKYNITSYEMNARYLNEGF